MQPPSQQTCSSEGDVCDIDGFCSNGSCLTFSSIDGDELGGLDGFASIDHVDQTEKSSENQPNNSKSKQFDSDYEKLMAERGQDMKGPSIR